MRSSEKLQVSKPRKQIRFYTLKTMSKCLAFVPDELWLVMITLLNFKAAVVL